MLVVECNFQGYAMHYDIIIHVQIIIRLKHKTDAVRVTHVHKCVYRSGNDNNNIRMVSLAGAYDGCAG